MKKKKIFALIKRIKKVLPSECQVEIVPTNQTGEIYLVIVQFPKANITSAEWTDDETYWESDKLKAFIERNPALKAAYLWEKQKIRNLHYETILPLLDDAEHFRAVYCAGSKFVFYAHTFGCFDSHGNIFDFIGVKSKSTEEFKYVGTCRHSDLIIDYLMTTYEML